MAGPYDVAIHLSAVNGVSGVLAVIGKDVLGLTGSVKTLQKELSALRVVAVGGMAALGGLGLGAALMGVANHSRELLDQQDKLNRSGIAMNEVLKIQANYYDKVASSIPTATAHEYLQIINELQGVAGSVEGAIEAAPFAAKLDAIISNSLGKKTSGAGFDLLKAAEMRGTAITDPEGTKAFVEMMAKVVSGSGGKITTRDFLNMAKTGGVAFMKASPEFITGPAASVAADLGGERTGTAMMTLYQLLTGSTTLSKQQYEVMQKAGMIDASKVSTDKGGRINAQPGAIIGSLEHQGNLFEWARILKPKLEAMSKGDQDVMKGFLDDSVFNANLAKIGRNRNAFKLLQMFTDVGFGEQIAKDIATWARGMGVDQAYQEYISRNPKGVEAAYEAQKTSMLQAIGLPLMQAAIPVMKAITEVFTKIGAIANANPEAIRAVGIAVAGLAATLTTVGAVLLGTALAGAMGPMLSFAAGIGAVASAIAGVVSVFWPQIKGALAGMKSGLDSISVAGIERATLAIVTNLSSAIASIPGQVAGAITAMASAIAAKISAAVSSIASGIANFGKSLLPGFLGGGAKTEPAAPSGEKHSSVLPPARQKVAIELHNHSYLDGRKVAQSVTRHQVARFIHPTSVGGMDTRGMWAPPSADSVG